MLRRNNVTLSRLLMTWEPLHAGLEAYHDKVVNPTGKVYVAYL